jgi:hypothetical protein
MLLEGATAASWASRSRQDRSVDCLCVICYSIFARDFTRRSTSALLIEWDGSAAMAARHGRVKIRKQHMVERHRIGDFCRPPWAAGHGPMARNRLASFCDENRRGRLRNPPTAPMPARAGPEGVPPASSRPSGPRDESFPRPSRPPLDERVMPRLAWAPSREFEYPVADVAGCVPRSRKRHEAAAAEPARGLGYQQAPGQSVCVSRRLRALCDFVAQPVAAGYGVHRSESPSRARHRRTGGGLTPAAGARRR